MSELKKVKEISAEEVVVEKDTTSSKIIDVIGLDVLRINTVIDTVEEAKAYIEEHASETFDILEVNGSTFIIRTIVADLNKINGVIPEDLEAHDAIPIQVKIGDILQAAGLNVGINENAQAEIDAALEKIETARSLTEEETKEETKA